MNPFDVAIVGSGFAGSILSRCLARLGLSVLLVEKARHPRFALGESSTPLAALSLERLAARWDLPDLHDLATWGRWRDHHSDLGCGLKRGFTFFGHEAGEPFQVDPENRRRLLVAASPRDEVADVHWRRADVDGYLARKAAEEGVELVEATEVVEAAGASGGFELRLRGAAGDATVTARTVVDASGAAAAVARGLGAGRRPVSFRSSLVYAHFDSRAGGVEDFASVLERAGAPLPAGPYPDDRAAVHHLFDGGWVYVLPFDDGVVSAGAISVETESAADLDPTGGLAADPTEEWRALLARYPSLGEQFAAAEPLFPMRRIDPLQWRLGRASGFAGTAGWVVLPHTFAFFDPIFSTGIAWSLVAVERLADAFAGAVSGGAFDPAKLGAPLERYGHLLEREADRLEALVRGAYLALADFPSFVEWSFLYFASVSFAETAQRLHRLSSSAPDSGPAWQAFLEADDPALDRAFAEGLARLEALRLQSPSDRSRARQELSAVIARAIEPRNVAGLGDPARRNLYPVDLDLLVERAGLVGLTPEGMRARLPDLLRA
jgi:FADH2 O2-dependent halogenase